MIHEAEDWTIGISLWFVSGVGDGPTIASASDSSIFIAYGSRNSKCLGITLENPRALANDYVDSPGFTTELPRIITSSRSGWRKGTEHLLRKYNGRCGSAEARRLLLASGQCKRVLKASKETSRTLSPKSTPEIVRGWPFNSSSPVPWLWGVKIGTQFPASIETLNALQNVQIALQFYSPSNLALRLGPQIPAPLEIINQLQNVWVGSSILL